MVTKLQLEQSAKLADLHREWRDPKKAHPERVEQLVKRWDADERKGRAAGSMTLDYVGHANLRDILCMEDPLWNWRALGTHPQTGAPVYDKDDKGWPIGLWIGLTIHGVEKLGYGSCRSGKDLENAVKELIGDALRNAAQSFGIAIALWVKSDLADLAVEHGEDPEQAVAATAAREAAAPTPGGQCPECHGPAGRHATACKAGQGAAAPANGTAPAPVNPPLTPEPPAPEAQPPAAEAAPPDPEQVRKALQLEVGTMLAAMRGQVPAQYAEEAKRQGWPGDLTTTTDAQLEAVAVWLRASPVGRVAAGTGSPNQS